MSITSNHTAVFGAEDGANTETRRLMERVRSAVLEAVSEGYAHAQISGLCGEGAFECALAHARHADLELLLLSDDPTAPPSSKPIP
jgi:hypothetical protein